MTDSCRVDSGGANEIIIPNALVAEDLPPRWLTPQPPDVDYFDSALAQYVGKPGRTFTLEAVGLGYHAKYHLEQIASGNAPVKFRDHAIMFDSAGDSATAAIKILMVNPHFDVGGASTDTAMWHFTCGLIEVV